MSECTKFILSVSPLCSIDFFPSLNISSCTSTAVIFAFVRVDKIIDTAQFPEHNSIIDFILLLIFTYSASNTESNENLK